MSASSLHAGLALEAKRKEIYTYQAPWLIYGMNWSVRPDQKFRLAIGSFEEECVLYLCPRARAARFLSLAHSSYRRPPEAHAASPSGSRRQPVVRGLRPRW